MPRKYPHEHTRGTSLSILPVRTRINPKPDTATRNNHLPLNRHCVISFCRNSPSQRQARKKRKEKRRTQNANKKRNSAPNSEQGKTLTRMISPRSPQNDSIDLSRRPPRPIHPPPPSCQPQPPPIIRYPIIHTPCTAYRVPLTALPAHCAAATSAPLAARRVSDVVYRVP